MLLFVFSIPWENSLVFLNLGTVSKILGYVAFFMFFLKLSLKKTHKQLPSVFTVMVIFFVYALFSFIYSYDVDSTILKSFTMFQLLILVFLILELSDNINDYQNILLYYVLGSYISIFSTYYSYYFNIHTIYSIDTRYVASGFDPNDLALTLVIGIPIAWYISLTTYNSVIMWVCRLYIPLSVYAILLTASRSAFITLIVSLMIIPATIKYFSPSYRILLVLILLLFPILTYSLVPETTINRLSTISSEISYGDYNLRKTIWNAGIVTLESNMMLGVGFGAFPAVASKAINIRTVAHNTILSVLFELGIIGFALYTIILLTLLYLIIAHTGLIKIFLVIIFTTWFVGVMSLTWETSKITWFVFALIITSHNILCRDKEQHIKL